MAHNQIKQNFDLFCLANLSKFIVRITKKKIIKYKLILNKKIINYYSD